jgi:hypothetical protein
VELGAFDYQTFTLYLQDVIDSGGRADALGQDLVFIHELSHFLQTATTPYGLFLHFLDCFQNRKVRDLCQSYMAVNPAGKIYIPARNWLRESNGSFFESLRRDYLQPWEAAAFLRNVLEGLQNCSASKAIKALRMIDVVDEVSYSDQQQACPPINYQSCRIGGHDVCEFAATLLEVIEIFSSARHGSPPSVLEPLLDRHFSGYDALFKHVYDHTGFMSPSRFALICLALGEVALFTPLPFLFDSSDGNISYEWSALHPGWRFLKALEVVEQVEPPKEQRIDKEYNRFLDAICRLCGWPTVSDVLSAGARIDPGDDLILSMFVESCKLRKKFPTLFVHPNQYSNWDVLWKRFLKKYVPPLAAADGIRVAPRSLAAKGAYYFLSCSTVTSGAMLGHTIDDLLPESFRKELAEIATGPQSYSQTHYLDLLLHKTLGISSSQLSPLAQKGRVNDGQENI